jgi:aminoglycoside phosphotransferase family enzyme
MSQLPALVQALLSPKAYPDSPRGIELVQTQISFVFLTGDHVYKVKKAVDFGFLDFTTLEKRRFYCKQEILLNRRLCPDVYLDVVQIVQDKGEIFIGDQGEVIEYAVKMRQLPRHRTMDQLLQNGQVTGEMMVGVANKLVEFHAKARTDDEIASYGELKTVRINTEENFAQTEGYIGVTIPKARYERIKDYTNSFMERNARLFAKRVKEGRIRDCHGDLHTAHICFANDIYIFDCIEFNDRFRYSDVASEIAFLAMDLDYHGRPDLAQRFVASYVAGSGDRDLLELLNFYKCYRAYVRGKVEGFMLADPHISEEEKERVSAVASRYFELAESYIEI